MEASRRRPDPLLPSPSRPGPSAVCGLRGVFRDRLGEDLWIFLWAPFGGSVSFPMLLFELWRSSPWTPGGSRCSWSGNEADVSSHPGPGAAAHLESVSFKAWFYLVSDFRRRVRLSLFSHRMGSLQKVRGKCILQEAYAWIFKQILHQKYLLIPFSTIFLKCARLCEAVLQHLK